VRKSCLVGVSHFPHSSLDERSLSLARDLLGARALVVDMFSRGVVLCAPTLCSSSRYGSKSNLAARRCIDGNLIRSLDALP